MACLESPVCRHLMLGEMSPTSCVCSAVEEQLLWQMWMQRPYPQLPLLWLCTVKTHSVAIDMLTRSQGAKQVGEVLRTQPDTLNW